MQTTFIEAWANGKKAFLNVSEISRISFEKPTKEDNLKDSLRKVKVLFRGGSKGEYVCHRNVEKRYFDPSMARAIETFNAAKAEVKENETEE